MELQVQISNRLCSTLEYIGVSEERRRTLQDKARSKEILFNIKERVFVRKPRSFYIFGSTWEGTTTAGLASDNDIVVCQDSVMIKECVDDSLEGHLLIIKDENTKPGYVKLQLVFDGVPLTVLDPLRFLISNRNSLFSVDGKGRIAILNSSFINDVSPLAVWNGPAITESSDGTYKDIDFVNTKRYCKIPSFADKWLNRERQFGWPSSECLDEMKTQGCFLVRKGHPRSSEAHLEWRVSFSLQERRLMESLNPTQYKTYILLKMIKKDLIEPKIGESISSYHLKTSLFYTIETTEEAIWVPSKLIECIERCLKQILIWLLIKNCPNYFISEENMFDRLHSYTRTQAAICIYTILKSQPKGSFIPDIRCDNVGHYFQKLARNENNIVFEKSRKSVDFVITTIYNDQRMKFDCLLTTFRKFGQMETLGLYGYLLNTLDEMKTIGPVAEHGTETVQNALAKTKRLFHLHAAICIACFEPLATESFEYCINKADGYDLMSAMLVKATVSLNLGNTEECRVFLTECETVLGPTTVSSCGCHRYPYAAPEWMFNAFQSSDESLDQMVNHIPASCLMFHPSEVNILPTAMLYEMYRSEFTSANPRKERTDDWFDWIAVDSKIYLFFLKYVSNQQTNNDRFLDLIMLLYYLKDDFSPGHIETGYNLAGWIFALENMPNTAFECFVISWKMRRHHNAAKWHVLCLLHDVVNEALSDSFSIISFISRLHLYTGK